MEKLQKITVVLPSLDPDEKLKAVVDGLLETGFTDIILVNDGSKPENLHWFEEMDKHPEVTLLHHAINRGKGAALKTAFTWFLENRPKQLGVVTVDGDKKPELKTFFPRFGFEFATPVKNDGFTYFGMGPGESYQDMNLHAPVGMYRSTAEKEYVPYVRPQEHGNHYAVKYLRLDSGLTFLTDSQFECNVSEYSTAALNKAEHTDELVKNGLTNVRVDYRVAGIGSHSCGPALREEFKVNEDHIHFLVYMR